MNLSKVLKQKRDAEDRLRQSSPQVTYLEDNNGGQYINLASLATKAELTSGLASKADNTITGTIAPTTSIVGTLGQFYLDTITSKTYQCTAINGSVYTWTEIVGGGGSKYELPQATETVLGGIKAKAKTTETVEVSIDSATGKAYVPPAGEAANGLPAGGTAGQIPSKIDDVDYNVQWINPSSGGGTPKNRIYVPYGTNLGYDDEFDDGVIDVNWGAVDVSGFENSWYETDGIKGLSVYIPNGVGAMKARGLLKAIPTGFSPPYYIETAVKMTSRSQNYPAAGLCFSDGRIYGSGIQVNGYYGMSNNYLMFQRWTGFNTRTNSNEYSLHSDMKVDYLYTRLVYESANTFSFWYSCDGVVWIKGWSNVTFNIVPAYFGFIMSTHDDSTYPFIANFAYFRVRSGLPVNG